MWSWTPAKWKLRMWGEAGVIAGCITVRNQAPHPSAYGSFCLGSLVLSLCVPCPRGATANTFSPSVG